MKLFGAIALHVEAEDILRAPRFFEKIKRAFGGKPDLRTGRARSALEATAIVEATRDALRKIGVTNAVSLVIDDTVLFHDREGTPDDLGDLFLAFHDNDSVFGQGFRELRLAVEHREAGLHLVLEIQARPEHKKDAPAARTLISGRIEALTPRPGEDAETYRKRAEPVATDAKALEMFRIQFTALVDRVRDALAHAMPTAKVEVEVAEPRITRPDPTADTARDPQSPRDRNYDPYDHYYWSPGWVMADMLMWSAMFSMMMPPHFHVVDHHNHVQGFADEPGIKEGPTSSAEPAATSEGNWYDGDGSAAASDTGADGGNWYDGGDSAGADSAVAGGAAMAAAAMAAASTAAASSTDRYWCVATTIATVIAISTSDTTTLIIAVTTAGRPVAVDGSTRYWIIGSMS
jgi:hypothetical protein